MLTEQEKLGIKKNLFPSVYDIVDRETKFPWHRYKNKITTGQDNSSQALAINLFGTIAKMPSHNQIVNAWVKALHLKIDEKWEIQLEEILPKELLEETKSSQIDAVAKGNKGAIFFECKFTEPDGGECSQTKMISKGKHKGVRQCNGNYEYQINPVNNKKSRCALSGKSIQYWDHVPDVFSINNFTDHCPCPFAKGWYQWMRNLVAANSFQQQYNTPAAFVVVYVDGPFPMAKKVKGENWQMLLQGTSQGNVPIRSISYQCLLKLAFSAANTVDKKVVKELEAWILNKIAIVRERR